MTPVISFQYVNRYGESLLWTLSSQKGIVAVTVCDLSCSRNLEERNRAKFSKRWKPEPGLVTPAFCAVLTLVVCADTRGKRLH